MGSVKLHNLMCLVESTYHIQSIEVYEGNTGNIEKSPHIWVLHVVDQVLGDSLILRSIVQSHTDQTIQVLRDEGEAADVERPPRLQGLQLDPHARTQLRALPTSPGRPEVGLELDVRGLHAESAVLLLDDVRADGRLVQKERQCRTVTWLRGAQLVGPGEDPPRLPAAVPRREVRLPRLRGEHGTNVRVATSFVGRIVASVVARVARIVASLVISVARFSALQLRLLHICFD